MLQVTITSAALQMPGGFFHAIGNPLSDGTWTYTWEKGRQLKRMQSVDTDASFVYNESGLRVQKTVNGVVTNYTLHGKNIVHMTQGDNDLHFFYDAQGKPSIVVFNGTPYSYVKNLQGDIIAILDSTGTVVVNYGYDAWGRPIKKEGSLAETLGTVQPFRYRGYVYDEETELYYLRSRYYSHQWCRFMNEDSCYNADSLLGYNLFCYVANSPICCIDVSGQIIGTFFGGIFGFACQGIISLCQGKSSKEAMGAALGGAVAGAINGFAADLAAASGGLGLGVSVLIGSMAGFIGSLVEYAYINGSLKGYSIEEGINSALSGALASLISHFTVDAVKDMLKKAWNETLDEAIKALQEVGVVDNEFMDNFATMFTFAEIEAAVFGASLSISDLIEIPTAE